MGKPFRAEQEQYATGDNENIKSAPKLIALIENLSEDVTVQDQIIVHLIREKIVFRIEELLSDDSFLNFMDMLFSQEKRNVIFFLANLTKERLEQAELIIKSFLSSEEDGSLLLGFLLTEGPLKSLGALQFIELLAVALQKSVPEK